MRGPTKGEEFYDGTALLGDPVHGYISFTAPRAPGEETEKDLIDTRWMQRLRRIYQLQRARWVYPSAEHSRFQHSLGAMHLAGRSPSTSLKATALDMPFGTFHRGTAPRGLGSCQYHSCNNERTGRQLFLPCSIKTRWLLNIINIRKRRTRTAPPCSMPPISPQIPILEHIKSEFQLLTRICP